MRILILFVVFCTANSVLAQTQPIPSQVNHFKDLQIVKEEARNRRQFLDGETTFFGNLEIHTSTLEPGKAPHPSHTHTDVEELIIVKEGKLKMTIKDKSKIVGPGSVAIAIPGEEHGFFNGGETPVTYYIIKYKSKTPMNVERATKNGGSFMIDWNDVEVKETDKGNRRNFFDKPTSMTDRFEMHVTTLNAGQKSHDPHHHRPEEILLIINGETSMQIGDRHENAAVGDLVFLGSEVLHALTNTGNGPCTYFAFQWQ
jgi:(S)-ureidoglycine aminohydrolase